MIRVRKSEEMALQQHENDYMTKSTFGKLVAIKAQH